MLEKFKFKAIDRKRLEHVIEKRGMVTVPFDYQNPQGETIDIFYRLIPAYGSTPDDRSKPIVVVINGGPGIPSSFYRALNFDYENENAPQNGPLNRFKYLLQTHRVLIADQRGTAGLSAPLDMEDENLDPYAVAKYFSSDSQARDYLAVIEKVIPKDEPFFIIAQSYGGMVGMQYLGLEQRIPKGIIFSSSAIPYELPIEMHVDRRKEQRDLNLQLKKVYPDIEVRLQKLRAHLKSLGMSPDRVNGLYTWLGKEVSGKWEKMLINRIDELLSGDLALVEKEFKSTFDETHLLNYILSSCNFTPGYTDRTLSKLIDQKVAYEPWMIDESWVVQQTGQEGGPSAGWVKRMDENPPPITPFASVEQLRHCVSKNRVLFTAAENDAFVPAVAYYRAIEKFQVPGHTKVRTLPGGHHAIFYEEGYHTILHWEGHWES